MAELSKVYEPKIIEAQATQLWNEGSCFHADAGDRSKTPYTIVIPPPNVTAALHLGHALNNTLQDILIRFHRMQGFNTLWMPGTDHAGIATQTVVEKRILAEENKRRTDFQRDEFVGRVQAWKDEYEARIIEQLKAMGCSCDWDRTRFTMDEVCAKAVRETFFELFKDGLIYRGKRLVNWDPATQTVLADDEVEHEQVEGHFWYMQYPLVEPVQFEGQTIEHVTVATTRPETMLGDTAVAMNPKDPRAELLIGKKVKLPIVGRIIPIIGDEHVVLPDPVSEDEKAKFSTGFLKVTPAHDPDDWQIGQRHDLPIVNVMAPDGTISDRFGWDDARGGDAEAFLGMDRYEAREAIVEWFRQEHLLEKVLPYTHEVGHSYRSHVPIEPYLSDQWYIAVKKPIPSLVSGDSSLTNELIEGTDVPVNSLAGLALKPLLDGKLRFIPQRYAKTYQAWLENLRDWPISRQLWWGHQIPVWKLEFQSTQVINPTGSYDPNRYPDNFKKHLESLGFEYGEDFFIIERGFDNLDVTIGRYVCGKTPEIQKILDSIPETNNIVSIERDSDVLDTWFSSALWPFSTLGWPDDKPEVKTFYPGDVLCTAREIITLWVSRMVMMGQYCAGDIPFKDVFIHAMIQDGQGRKMSKSLGNGIDPLIVIDSHGADAMRFTLANMTTETQDIRMPVESMTLPDRRTVNTSPKFDIGRNFCNKLWNASRFALMNLEDVDPKQFDKDKLTAADKWILSRLAKAAKETTEAIQNFKYSEPTNTLYHFFWNDFCDWYLEWLKPRMQDENQKPIAQNVLAFVLDQILRLMHPFIPFITEGIFSKLNEQMPSRALTGLIEPKPAETLVCADWPSGLEIFINDDIETDVAVIQTIIRSVRDIRSQYSIAPRDQLTVSVNCPDASVGVIRQNGDLICRLAGLGSIDAAVDTAKPKNAAVAVEEDLQIYVHDVIDPQEERTRLEKQKAQLQKAQKVAEAKLANKNFVEKAKPEVVEQARVKLDELNQQLAAIEQHLYDLQ